MSMAPPPTLPFTSITCGPDGVSFTSTWTAPERTPRASAASTAARRTASARSGDRWWGRKLPVSRHGSASGNFPVTASGVTTPLRATASTDT